MSTASRIAYLDSLIAALQEATLAIVRGEFAEVDAVQQRFKTHDPAKLDAMLREAERERKQLKARGGRGGVILRQGR